MLHESERLAVIRRLQSGLTLIELMIAMAIGLFLMAVVSMLFVNAKQTYRTQDNLARIQETGRFAMDILGRGIRDAGYTNISFAPPASKYSPPSATSFSGAAIAGNDGTTDAITVSFDSPTDCLNVAAPANRAVNAFSINASSQLVCLGNGGGAAQAILDDIEDLQVFYGEDINGDGNADRYIAAGGSLVAANVTAVRLCVLVRSGEDNIAPQAQTYVNCSGASVTATDRRIRRAFGATYVMRNRTS